MLVACVRMLVACVCDIWWQAFTLRRLLNFVYNAENWKKFCTNVRRQETVNGGCSLSALLSAACGDLNIDKQA